MARSAFLRVVTLVALAAGATGCPAAAEDVRPPEDQFFFPSGLEVSPDEHYLFVVNANSELRYDSGTLLTVDLDRVDALVDEWLATAAVPGEPADCEQDILLPRLLVCNEEDVVLADATVRLGNFAASVKAENMDSGDLRLFVAARGDPSITWVDFYPSDHQTDCGGSGEPPRCDEDHRLTQLREDLELPTLSDEPYGIYVDSAGGYAAVTHFTSATVSLIDAPTDGRPPMLADVLGGLFASDPTTGVRGAVGVAGRSPGTRGSLLYVTSRSESRVQTMYVHRPSQEGGAPTLVPSEFFFLNRVLPSDDGRGLAFSADGNRLHVLNRNPPMLQTIDTSAGPDGYPQNTIAGAVEICSRASQLVLADVGGGERAFVSCFSAGQVWVVDTESSSVDAIINVGRGPHAVAVAPSRRRLYVTNFLEDTISVVDLTPEASTEYRVVLRLGRTRDSGGN